jgi:transcriptional regulator with XRE-family HTH domain
MSISQRIKQIRVEKKLTGKEFATAINVDNSQYSKIENGKLAPTIDHLMELYSKFNVSIDWLLSGEGEMFRGSEMPTQAYSESFFYNEIKALNREIGELINENKRLREMQDKRAYNLDTDDLDRKVN